MSQFPKLKIDVRDLTPNKKIKFVFNNIEPEPPPKQNSPLFNKINNKIIPLRYVKIIGIIIVVVLLIVLNSGISESKLRRIVRMDCHHTTFTTCTAYGHGSYNVRNCLGYEYNGVPFTEFLDNNNIIVPSAPDMTLRIVPACPSIVATLDTTPMPNKQYPMKGSAYHDTIVWVCPNCYKEFSLTIDQMVIFEHTPVQDLTHISYRKGNTTAYRMVANGHDFQLKGYGCDRPIHIYIK